MRSRFNVLKPLVFLAAVQGINIQPQFFNIAPTGVNIQPQGVSISPNLIVIGPYDTTVAGQVSIHGTTQPARLPKSSHELSLCAGCYRNTACQGRQHASQAKSACAMKRGACRGSILRLPSSQWLRPKRLSIQQARWPSQTH